MGTLLIHCGFSTSFEQIEENRVRTIDFTYRNCADTTLCEASPGDSMEITALFAGEKVTDIALTVSFNVQLSKYGIYNTLDSMPLDYTIIKSTLQSPISDADTFTFRFKIPDSLLAASSFLPEDSWAQALPDSIRPLIPSIFTSMKKSDIIKMLDTLSNQSVTPDSIFGFPLKGLLPYIEPVLQIFSAPVEIRALVNKHYEIVSYSTVRFHRRLQHIDNSIVCNRNPFITRMGIYRVYQNNLTYFDPAQHTQRHDTVVLYDKERNINHQEYTLQIEKDVSYFLFAQSDTPQVKETHYFEWFYQQDFTGSDSVSSDEGMALLQNADGPIIPLHPAATRSVDQCGIWVQVRDDAAGLQLYPTGSSVFRTKIFFTYSDEYIKKQEVLK
jgi:hypothetical protein